MNKRIKELAKEAGYTLINDYYTNGNVMAFSDAQLEKFAELIVRECASESKLHVMNISTYADAEFVQTQIENHFGVKE